MPAIGRGRPDRMEAREDMVARRIRAEHGRRVRVLRAGARPLLVARLRSKERLFDPAALRRVAAARSEPARRHGGGQIGRHARNRVERLRAVMVEARDRAEERLRVRVPHVPEQLVRARALDDLSGVHHHDPVGSRRDHAEVVRDQDDRHLRSRRSASIRSRIWAWIVTSSAVVGSSAMSSFGEHASAIAIITRWRMPPESWWG